MRESIYTSRSNEYQRHLDTIGWICDKPGARVSLRVMPGGKEGLVNPFKLVRSNPHECVREQRTKSVSGGRGESEAHPPFALTPLTGRDTEFSLLKDRWEQAQEGMGQVLLVVGQPGLGKSRLVQTLTQRVQAQASDASLTAAGESASASVDQDSQVIEWHCSQHFQNSELHPVSDYLERFLRGGRDPSPTACFDRLARHLEDYDLCKPELLALFAKLLFLPPDERYSGTGLTPPESGKRPFARWVNGCARTPISGRSC